MNGLEALWYFFLVAGYSCLVIPPMIPAIQQRKLVNKDFALEVGLPVLIGLVLIGLAYYNLLITGYDENIMAILIAVTASGGIFISLLVAILSNLYIRWRAS